MANLIVIKATFHCDGCGKPIVVEIDPARTTEGWSVFDYAVDAVRGGFVMASVQGANQCLCPACTAIVDAFVTEDRNATDDEINAALNAHDLVARK